MNKIPLNNVSKKSELGDVTPINIPGLPGPDDTLDIPPEDNSVPPSPKVDFEDIWGPGQPGSENVVEPTAEEFNYEAGTEPVDAPGVNQTDRPGEVEVAGFGKVIIGGFSAASDAAKRAGDEAGKGVFGAEPRPKPNEIDIRDDGAMPKGGEPDPAKFLETVNTYRSQIKEGGEADLSHFNTKSFNTDADLFAAIESTSQMYSKKMLDAKGGSKDSKPGVRSQKVTRSVANLMGVSPNKLLKNLFAGQVDLKNLDATMLATRDLMVWSGSRLEAAAQKALSSDTTENLLEFRHAMTLHAEIQAKVSGAKTEIARALSSYKIPAREAPGRVGAVEELLTRAGGREGMADMLSMYKSLDTPAKKNKFIKDSIGRKTFNAMYEAWINALLSSPHTQIVNFTANIVTTFGQIPTKVVAGGIGGIRRTITGATDGVRMGEGAAEVVMAIQSTKKAIMLAGKTLKTGQKPDFLFGSKLDKQNFRVNAFSGENFKQSGMVGSMIDMAGHMFTLGRLPTKLMEAGDVFFKVLAHDMSAAGSAYRAAVETPGTVKEMAERYADGLLNPTKEALEEGGERARYVTLQSEFGKYGKAAQTLTRAPIVRWFVPFTRTPLNSLKLFAEHSPIGMLGSKFRADVAAGGAKSDIAIARMSMGTGVMGYVASQVAAGKITGGGPKDPELRANLMRTGWRPYSYYSEADNAYYPYQRLDPLAMVIGMAADIGEIWTQAFDDKNWNDEKISKLIAAGGMAIAKNVTSRTYMEGLSSFLESVEHPDTKGSKWMEGMVRSWVPRVIKNVENFADPEIRQTRSLIEQFQGEVPGWGSKLPAKVDLWGNKMMARNTSPINPYNPSEKKMTAADEEMIRLEVKQQPVSEGIPGLGNGKNTLLEPNEYSWLATRAGKLAFERIDKLVKGATYKNLPSDNLKRTRIKGEFRAARSQAIGELHKQFPYLREIIKGVKMHEAKAMKGEN